VRSAKTERYEVLRRVVEDETQSKDVHARYIGIDRLSTRHSIGNAKSASRKRSETVAWRDPRHRLTRAVILMSCGLRPQCQIPQRAEAEAA